MTVGPAAAIMEQLQADISLGLARVRALGGPDGNSVLVAYSGGLDSRVLLETARLWVAKTEGSVRALHVDHGLHQDSATWAEHCQTVCTGLNIPLTIRRLHLDSASANLEAQAREARYRVFEAELVPGETLWMGHHQDDQAETVLARALQGHGLRGLAGIPACRQLGQGWLFRPLLSCSREQLKDIASAQAWNWIEDPSNSDCRYERNFLRHEVLPKLESRYPSASRRLAQTARHLAEALDFQERQLAVLVSHASLEGGRALDLKKIPEGDWSLAIRSWFHDLGIRPRESHWEEWFRQLTQTRAATLESDDWSIRVYHKVLYAIHREMLEWLRNESYRAHRWEWPEGDSWVLPDGRRLNWPPGLRRQERRYLVGFRQGGERLWDPRKGCHRDLKNVFQERGIPPWWRPLTPLLWQEDTLVAVLDYS